MQNYDFIIFHKLSPLYNNVYEACLFATLGMFLHDTTRIKGKSLRKFIEANASINPNRKNKAFELDNAETLLRQKRYRLLSSRPTYNQRSEWSAMPKDSEYEWTLMYALDNEKAALQDTFKRIGNLYNDIYKEFHSNKDDGYIDRLEKAYKRFLSKLKKIKFENYLELQKTFLSHISKDKTYYGMNLYRFEKANRLYINTNEIKSLLECTNDIEERNILAKSSILNGIYFPKLYENFASLSTLQEISFCSINFSIFFDYVVSSSRLIIDELVEKGYWGEVWEMFFLLILSNTFLLKNKAFSRIDISV